MASGAASAATTAALKVASLFSVAGKVAVVTGGGRGIGEMISRAFVENGAKVYITSRSVAACQRKADELSKLGPGKCFALPQDLSSEAGVKEFATALSAREKAVDILVNNSGISWGASFDEFPEAQFDRVFALNVKAVFLVTRALRPLLEAGHVANGKTSPSRIINIGSVAGFHAMPAGTYSYDPSKAAVHSLTKKLAYEFAPSITVNAIAPGIVPSRMTRGLLQQVGEKNMVSGVPMGRLGVASDMGGAAIFLSSAAGQWLTGHILVVDGGQSTCIPLPAGDFNAEEADGEGAAAPSARL